MNKVSKQATVALDSVYCNSVAQRYKYNNILLCSHLETLKERKIYFD